MDKNIPLSELIRIGAKATKKCEGHIASLDGETCAIGAAYVGKFGEMPPHNFCTNEAVAALGIKDSVITAGQMPVKIEVSLPISEVVWRLNDQWDWSRERIADWLESIGK